jgi:hypothetical protein
MVLPWRESRVYRERLESLEFNWFDCNLRAAGVYSFTVFTPTYNRAHSLPRVYSSLESQTYRDFEWLVVDDGSTDDTRSLIDSYSHKATFPIRYIYQHNAHKKTAFNRGVRESGGELFLQLDSDDEYVPKALERFWWHWMNIPAGERARFSAVTALCVGENGHIVGTRFPTEEDQKWIDSDSLEMQYRYHVQGDKCGFQRTEVLREFPFPENVQGLVPEGVVWSTISRHYRTRYVNEALQTIHQEGPDRLTRQRGDWGKHADGHALWAREVLENEWQWLMYAPVQILKMAGNYTRFHRHLHHTEPSKQWPLKTLVPLLLVFLMWPLGMGQYWLDLKKRRR